VGVSCDSAASHKRFIDKNTLPFSLISDPDHKLAEEMGVWGEKSMCGRKYFGILRTTFLVDESGIIERIYGPKEVKTKIHADQILGKI
jgi:peroxiredoxin Q/BCP